MRALLDLLKRMPGTILGLVVGVLSMAVWVPRALPSTVPPVPAAEAGVGLALSPRLDAGSTFEISQEVLAARGGTAAAAPATQMKPAAGPEAETVPESPTVETAPVAPVSIARAEEPPARRSPPPPPPGRPPRRFVYAPPGEATARVPSVPTAAAGGGGPAPVADEFGLTADALSTIALRPDNFGVTSR